jgi:thioredoxin-dependent peroxiredoxin
VDTLDATKQFAQQLGLDYPLLSDPDRTVARAYGVITGDQAFAARWTFYIGIDGRILYIDKQVTVTTAGRAIADKLAELGVARRKPVRRR